ncbi:porin family protein [Mucilaginibacter antarcticus]
MVGACSLTQAQVTKGQTEFGLGIGYGASYVTEGGSGQTSKSIGVLNVAASLDHYFSDRWSLKAKVVYDKKGWGNGFITDLSTGKTVTGVQYNYDYITVPVMANWHFGKTRNWYLNFGPYVGFLLSAEAKDFNLDVKPYSATTDAGLAVGIGVKIPLSEKLKFFVEYDGQSGFVNVIKSAANSSQMGRGSFNVGLNF